MGTVKKTARPRLIMILLPRGQLTYADTDRVSDLRKECVRISLDKLRRLKEPQLDHQTESTSEKIDVFASN